MICQFAGYISEKLSCEKPEKVQRERPSESLILCFLCLFVAICCSLGLAFALTGHYDARLLLGFLVHRRTKAVV